MSPRGAALVTGAGRRIGQALALEAARAGYDVAVHHRGDAGEAADAALRWFWQAWATALVAACLKPRPPVPLLPWPTIVQRALASNDAHVIQLVDACREEQAALGGSDWQQAASRAVTPG